jgi:cobalt-zinc-cadmium efflux system outer membrane protein
MKKISLACLVLSGCAGTAPEPPVDWERERPTAPQQAPDRLAVPDVASLTLERAWAVADSLHPDLAAARSRVEAAEGRALQAGLLPNPTLLGRLESAPFEGKTLENAEILAGISQRLPVGGRLGAARDVEDRERERLILDYHVQRAGLRARIHAAFAAALYSEAVVRLLREGRELADRGVAVAQARRAAGDALPEEVARVELERVRADVELDQAQSLREAAVLALSASLGDPRLKIGALEGGLEAVFDVPSIETVLAGLDRGPFAALAEAETAVARAKVDQAKLERIPDVTLDLLYRRLEASETNAFDVGVSVALPLFDRN